MVWEPACPGLARPGPAWPAGRAALPASPASLAWPARAAGPACFGLDCPACLGRVQSAPSAASTDSTQFDLYGFG